MPRRFPRQRASVDHGPTGARGSERSAAECLLKISDASIEAVFASEREEAMVPVEGEGSIVDRIDDHGTRAELSCSGDRPDESVATEVGAEPSPMHLAVERELGEE